MQTRRSSQRDSLVTKYLGLQRDNPTREKKFTLIGSAVGHVVLLLRFCALCSEVDFCGCGGTVLRFRFAAGSSIEYLH